MRIRRSLFVPRLAQFSVICFACVLHVWIGAASAHAAPSVVMWGSYSNVPSQVSSEVTSARQVVAGYTFDTVIRNNGTMVVWRPPYVSQVWTTNVLAVALGEYSSYGSNLELKTNHTLMVDWYDATPPPEATNVVAVANGVQQFLALKSDGTVAAWGLGFTNLMPGLSNVVAIASGASHYVALKNDGTVVAWINNRFTNVFTNVPAGLSNVVAISAGDGISLALRSDGTVVPWGGLFSPVVTNVPPGLTNVIAISCGDGYAVALKNDGTVTAWGDGFDGDTDVPPGLTNVTLISARQSHTLAVVDPQPPLGPIISGTIVSNNIFSVAVPSISGRVYYLEHATDLSAPVWIPLPLVAGTGGTLTLQDTNLADQKRFYRVRRW